MSGSIIQHVENEKQPYRVPVFTIKPSNIHFSDKIEKNASVVRLTTCDFVTNYYNVSYTSNCLRWLRIPNINSNSSSVSKISGSPDNPYYDLAIDGKSIHLCKLYITPGAYETVDDIILEINKKLYNSFQNLLSIGSTTNTVYTNQEFNYQFNPNGNDTGGDDGEPDPKRNIPTLFTDSGIQEIKDADVSEATLINPTYIQSSILSSEMNTIYYYVDGVIRYKSNEIDDNTKTATDAIIAFDASAIAEATLSNAVIALPFLTTVDKTKTTYNNDFDVIIDNGTYYIRSGTIPEKFNESAEITEESTTSTYADAYRNIFISGTIINSYAGKSSLITLNTTRSESSMVIVSAALEDFETHFNVQNMTGRFEYQVSQVNDLDMLTYSPVTGDSAEDINQNFTVSIYLPTIDCITTDPDNGSFSVDWSEAEVPVIEILDTQNKVAFTGSPINLLKETEFPNKAAVLGESSALPELSFKLSEGENFDIHEYSALKITMSGSWNPTSSAETPTVNSFIARLRKLSIESEGQQTEILSCFGLDIANLVHDGTQWTPSFSGNDDSSSVTINASVQFRSSAHNATVGVVCSIKRSPNGDTANASEFKLLDRHYMLTKGEVSNGSIRSYPPSIPIDDLFTLNSDEHSEETTYTARENRDLLYDPYYNDAYKLILQTKAGDVPSFVTPSVTTDNKLCLKWYTSIIPVTTPTIYTTTLNFLNVMKDPNFETKFRTELMQKVLTYDGYNNTGTQTLTTNNYKLSRYTKQSNLVDSYYYNFQIDKKDLWYKLGFTPCIIDYNKSTIMSYNSTHKADESDNPNKLHPVYLIKGIYYSECLYNGPIRIPSVQRLDSSDQDTGVSDVHQIILPAGYDLMKLLINQDNETLTNQDYNLFNTYFCKTFHYAPRLANLSIPKTIEIKLTQNKDIEEYLNSNEIVDSIASIGQYKVVRDNEATIASIQQSLEINSTIEIPDSNPIYVYLTNGNEVYSIMDTVATLNVEYIN